MKTFLVLITIVTLFVLISCDPPKKETGQTQQVPLSSESVDQPDSTNTEPVQSVVKKTAEQASQPQNNAEAMLNPPHGEPFHRCDIPVGAPLSSPPASTPNETTNKQVQAATPNPTNNPTAPTVENAKRLNTSGARKTSTANNGSKPHLNPPHGEPFHRCDIPVGSPLP